MSHFDVQFKEALKYAVSRDVVPSNAYYEQMTALQRQASVSIAGLAQVEQIRHIIDLLNKSLDSGSTFDEFVKSVQAADIQLPRHRLDNIYRTNIQSAYNRGKWYEQQANKDNRPYLMYSAINDTRTRPHHKSLHGVIRHIDDGFWLTHTPPLGFRCRCTTRALTAEQAKQRGITADDDDRLNNKADSDDWGLSPANYASQFKRLIQDSIAKTALENPKNAADLVNIANRIEQTIAMSYPLPTLDELLSEVEDEK